MRGGAGVVDVIIPQIDLWSVSLISGSESAVVAISNSTIFWAITQENEAMKSEMSEFILMWCLAIGAISIVFLLLITCVLAFNFMVRLAKSMDADLE